MIHALYKKIADRCFYWWMEKDLKKLLQLIETKSLKKTAEYHGAHIKDKKSPLVEEWKRQLWNYGACFLENTYKEGDPPVCKATIQEQAEHVTADLTAVFIEKKEKQQIPLSAFFPAQGKQANTEAAAGSSDMTDFFKKFQNGTDIGSFKKVVKQIKQERAFQVMIDTLLEDLLSYLPDKPFRPKEKHHILLVWRLLHQAGQDIKRFSKKHSISFSHDGEIRCFYNMLNLYLHHFAVKGKIPYQVKERELYFAASALHPLQDDYMDEGEPHKDTIAMIGEKVKGNPVGECEEQVRGIFDLIDVIYKAYPVQKNPTLVSVFTELFNFQCQSTEQKSDRLDEEALLRISFMKGGYAFAFFGSVVHGEMSVAQFNHFFIMGAVFQLLDDFHDIQDDLKSGSSTVWTRGIQKGEKLDAVLNAVIGLQHYYEEKTSLVEGFNHPVLMRRIELVGIRYDTFRFFTMNEAYFSEEYVTEFESHFPFSLSIPKRIYNSSRPYEQIDTLLAMLEEGKRLFMK